MKIGEPKAYFDSLDEEARNAIIERVGSINNFLGPNDTFKFSCKRHGDCCTNRDNNPILCTPYDAFRMQTQLGINSHEFKKYFADLVLASEPEFPVMLLSSPKVNDHLDQCVFLDNKACRVYEARPLVCRLYPLGRILDQNMTSYFFKVNTNKNCGLGNDPSYTIDEWIKKTNSKSYLDWSEKFYKLLMEIDLSKYQGMPDKFKSTLATLLYDNTIKDRIPSNEDKNSGNHNKKQEFGPNFNLEATKLFIDKYLK
ncbi:MAG: YkgJ family cysteine cluster protein [Candidatus Zixiibacteriota bacterium]